MCNSCHRACTSTKSWILWQSRNHSPMKFWSHARNRRSQCLDFILSRVELETEVSKGDGFKFKNREFELTVFQLADSHDTSLICPFYMILFVTSFVSVSNYNTNSNSMHSVPFSHLTKGFSISASLFSFLFHYCSIYSISWTKNKACFVVLLEGGNLSHF